MNIDFHQEALKFMDENGCKRLVPIEIVKKAMERGACIMVDKAKATVSNAHLELMEKRARANRPQ